MFDSSHKNKSASSGAGRALIVAAVLACVALSAGCSSRGITAQSVAQTAQAAKPQSAAEKAAEAQAKADFAAQVKAYAALSVPQKAALVEKYVRALRAGEKRWYDSQPVDGPPGDPSLNDVIGASFLWKQAPHGNLWMPFHGADTSPAEIQLSLADSGKLTPGEDGGDVCQQIDSDAQQQPAYAPQITCAPLNGQPGFYLVSYLSP